MKRIFLYALSISLGIVLFGCDAQEDYRVPKTTRSMSIAGMPVYEKDFALNQVRLVDHTVSKYD
ncbi:NF038215 family lipoprotein [Acinetobacter ihumii]|uniref:NF038215 family lipoprotein n=1 Tax=Acinetobacter ihumii TaxID=2483802 RepID=UPI001031D37C|nr:NF038215 family lipoprotein [Acinetobacter ihumii]